MKYLKIRHFSLIPSDWSEWFQGSAWDPTDLQALPAESSGIRVSLALRSEAESRELCVPGQRPGTRNFTSGVSRELSKVLFFAIATYSFSIPCFGQSSWLDFSSAIPKVLNPGGTSNFNTSMQGFPSTTGFANTPYSMSTYNPNNSAGFGVGGYSGHGGAGLSLAPARKDWKLGVLIQNTDAGAVITQVTPGSAGQQAGLQPNDIIVAVGGSRIGTFDNRIIELADEIRRNADAMGRVSLLVFNSRQRMINPLAVSMNSTSSTLTGTVATRDRSQLPYGAALTVQLQYVLKPFYEIAGGKSVTRADGVGPYGFELYFDPRYIDPREQYQLTASISVGNQLMYGLAQPILVDINNLGQPLNFILEKATVGQSFGNPGQSPISPGSLGNVSAGYPGTYPADMLNNLFFQLLGRAPSAREVVAWGAYLQQGNSINDLKVKLLSSSQFRDRFPNEATYTQQLISSLTNRSLDQQELAFWITRMQSTGSPEQVINEFLAKNR
ncbi:MAG TPA: YbaY family lipoprotein [Pirellula sp.]|nr:YbaY family lipoprotein [Pirellula sp.]